MALAAELLLSGLSSSSSQLSRSRIMCEMCKKTEKRYKCPGCSVVTCSLECCNLHKTKLGCDGRRDATTFRSLSQFDDNALLSDYLFLERAARMVNSTHRGFKKFRLEFRSEWVQRLVKACNRRRIMLRTVAPNMSRGFQNKTCFISKKDVIMWQIEWVFPSINRKYIQTGVNEYDRVPDALYNLMTTNHAIAPVLRPYKLCYTSEPEPAKTEVKDSTTNETREPATTNCSLRFLLRVKPNRHCFDRWLLIDMGQTLAANLRQQCIVEHPTIAVILPNESIEPYMAENGRVPSWISTKKQSGGKIQAEKASIKPKMQPKLVEEKEEGEIDDDEVEEDDEDGKRESFNFDNITDTSDEEVGTPAKKSLMEDCQLGKTSIPQGGHANNVLSSLMACYGSDTDGSEEDSCNG